MSLWDMTVREARDLRIVAQLARELDLGYGVVRGRISRAHGRTLIRNLFRDIPDPKRILASDPASNAAPKENPSARRASRQKRHEPSERTIHRVRQEFLTSCGVAVVAMFARVGHAEAQKVLFPHGAREYYTRERDVMRALDHFGVPHAKRWCRFTSWKAIPRTSLVMVQWHHGEETGLHWVIFQRRSPDKYRVLDPQPINSHTLTLSKHELSSYRGVKFLPVDPIPPQTSGTAHVLAVSE